MREYRYVKCQCMWLQTLMHAQGRPHDYTHKLAGKELVHNIKKGRTSKIRVLGRKSKSCDEVTQKCTTDSQAYGRITSYRFRIDRISNWCCGPTTQ